MALVGLNVVLVKLLATALPLPTLLAVRCLFAAAILLAWQGRAVLRLPPPAALLNLAAQAAIGTIAYNALLVLGLRRTGALEAGLVLATIPAVVAVGAWLWLRETLPARRAAAAVLAGLGMAAIALGRGGVLEGALLGDLLVFGAVLAEAGYMLLAKRAAAADAAYATFWMQALGGLMMAPFAVLAGPGGLGNPSTAALLAFHSLTASVLAVVLWYAGLRRVPGGVAGVFGGLLPLTAGMAAIVLLGERPTAAHAAGAALMFASIALATYPARG